MMAVQLRPTPGRSAPLLGDGSHRGARSIPIRIVPRTAIETLVARLIAGGLHHV